MEQACTAHIYKESRALKYLDAIAKYPFLEHVMGQRKVFFKEKFHQIQLRSGFKPSFNFVKIEESNGFP